MKMNLLRELPDATSDEVCTILQDLPNGRIERIVSNGQSSPEGFWYQQTEDEWITVLTGAAELEFEDHTIRLAPGDCLNIPAGMRHRVAWTTSDQPTVWLAVFTATESLKQ